PILFEKCGPCHRPGQQAPFSLLDYRVVRDHARQIAMVTEQRIMPPWLPQPGFGDFAGTRRLSADEVARIQEWVEQGADEGLASQRPEPPHWTDGWQLGQPDQIVSMSEPYTL